MADKRLTKRLIEAAPALEAEHPKDRKRWTWIGDTEVPGFGVKVYGTGRKVFALRYRTRTGGRTRMLTIGPFGEITVQKAREEARREREKVRQGTDPQAERKKARQTVGMVTVDDLMTRWLEDYAKKDGGRKTWREDERRVVRNIRPALGSLHLCDIVPSDVKTFHGDLGKAGKVEANRTIETLRAAWKWADSEDHLPDGAQDPTKRYGGKHGFKFKERSRDRWLRHDETKRLLEATAREPDPHVRAAIPLLLLTGLRKSELLSAQWKNIDLMRGEIRLPNTKSGESQTRTLTKMAMGILRELPRMAESSYVFPSPGDPSKCRGDLKKPWVRIRKAAGIADVTLHDLRRTCGSYLAQEGVPVAVIKSILGHADEKVTELYTRLSEGNERGALEGLSTTVTAIMEGEAADPSLASLPDQLRALLDATAGDPEALSDGLRRLGVGDMVEP